MKRLLALICCATSLHAEQAGWDASSCSMKIGQRTIPLHGTFSAVDSFPDFTVSVVENFPDLNVLQVENFPDQCGKWQQVSAFADFKIKFVTSFPDLKIKYVEHFPGVP